MEHSYDAIIIGAGPAGIFAALELADRKPQASILIVDAGRAIRRRTCPARINGQCVHCDPCSIVHGWAGAGAFSDGKLSLSDEVGGQVSDYLGHKRAMEYIGKADQIYLRFGANETVHGLNDRRVEEIAYEASPPPVVRGHAPKLRFAHPGGENPPTFVVHGSRLRTLPATYTRYLENFFRKRFKLVGTPVRFVFKEGENPYKDRKNVLSERQVAKKKRLIRHVKRKG